MTPSDWIALGALFVAAISIIFGYLNNKANIRARRAEIVTAKSIEAFRELAEKITRLSDDLVLSDFERISSSRNDFRETLNKYRFYIPISIFVGMVELNIELIKFSERIKSHGAYNIHDKEVGFTFKTVEGLIERMQRYAGLENEDLLTMLKDLYWARPR